MQPSLTVKSSPDKSGNDLFVVHEGLVVEEEDQAGDWKRIKLPDGNTGWVPAKSLEQI
jgi:SH3-like domain-containing protein